jgi:hypothetical protein
VRNRICIAESAMVTRERRACPMGQDPRIVGYYNEVSAPCRVDEDAGRAPFARGPVTLCPVCRQPAWLRFATAFLTTTFLTTAALASICASEAKAGAVDVDIERASGAGETSGQPAQPVTGDPEELQKALDQEHRRAQLLARELTTVRNLEMVLTLQKARVEAAKLRQPRENEKTEPATFLQQERERLRKVAESGFAELCKSVSGDAPERLVQDLAARHDLEMQTALAKASNEVAKLKQAAKGDTAELRKSLQEEQERAGQLEQELTTARRDVETQTALAAKATNDASQAKQAAEASAAALRKSLQQEQERADRLAQDLASARREVETQTALAAKATGDASQAKQAAEGSAAALRKSLQQEQERAGQLAQDLASAQRKVETQTALAAKATDDASQAKQVAELGSEELRRSLQKEHERAEALAQELSTAHATIYAYEAQARRASDAVAGSEQVSDNGAAGLQKSLQQEQERAQQLEQDLAAARRDVETQTVRVAKANENAVRLKQAAEHDSAELQRSLQKEHDRAEALAQNLSMMHTAIYTYDVQTRMASEQAKGREQAEQSGAAELRKSLVEAWERAARLQQDLAAARRDAETQSLLAAKASADATRLKQVADDSSADPLRSLQQERESTTGLDLASAQKTKDVPAVSGSTTGRITRDGQPGADAIMPVAATQTSTAAAQSNADPDLENAAEVARLMARANVLLGQGAIGSARSVLERAAEAGNAQASFALAETYDPLVLRRWGTYGTHGDVAKARDLYARAQAGGIKEAKERFDALRPR